MRTALIALSSLAVALAATCGQTPIKPDLSHVNPKFSEAIVGGDVAIPYSWPWMVEICKKSATDNSCELSCGATVVAPGWVATAGQCVWDDRKPTNYRLKAGVFDEAKSDEDAEQVVGVKSIHIHSQYNFKQYAYDFALIELDTPLKLGDHIQPVCLPSTDTVALKLPGSLWVTGWGTTSEHSQTMSRELRQADVPLADQDKCYKEYPAFFYSFVEFCAGARGIDTCTGDIGGPMVAKDKTGAWFQYGITSFGKGCGDIWGEEGVYARVSAFCDFIESTTKGVVKCQNPVL